LSPPLARPLFAGPAVAAPPPVQTPPKPQTAPPATQTPPPAQKPAAPAIPPAATAAPIVPLPADAKFAFIDLQRVADESLAGKAAIAQVKVLADKKQAEIQNLQTQINALQQKKQTSGGLLISVAADQAEALLALAHEQGFARAAVVGRVIEGPARVRVVA